ncbi:hypothetical protein BJV78DRAFT_1275273 [Lactifluus subvellereus]|nr:hypothetical protein BJV78DRAFT_1275273 [Lactifluus subvellereus]
MLASIGLRSHFLSDGPPPGYGWEDRDRSLMTISWDTFLGRRRCIVCVIENPRMLQHCHIIVQSEQGVNPQHEPRDGLLMCIHHHIYFDKHHFHVTFLNHWKQIRRFVFVNYSSNPDLQKFHGKAVALDIRDHRAPFSSLFIVHEMRVRGFHPFEPIEPTMPNEVPWQDWIYSDCVFDSMSGSFKRDRPRGNPSNDTSLQQQPHAGEASSGGRKLELNADIITDILAATHVMPSWAGTAEENIQMCVSSIDVEDPNSANGNQNTNS